MNNGSKGSGSGSKTKTAGRSKSAHKRITDDNRDQHEGRTGKIPVSEEIRKFLYHKEDPKEMEMLQASTSIQSRLSDSLRFQTPSASNFSLNCGTAASVTEEFKVADVAAAGPAG